MIYLIDKFARLCIKYPNNSLEYIFNAMIDRCSDKEAGFMADNFILFIKCGENIRKASPEVRNCVLQ